LIPFEEDTTMMGRREFGAAGLSAAAWVALQASGAAGEPAKRAGGTGPHSSILHGGRAAAFAECAKACSDCQRECDACSTHCLRQIVDGKIEHVATQETCRDCADLCAVAAQITARSGVFSELICQSCAEACARCAAACEKIPHDEHMARCAKECHRCEEACRKMLTETGANEHHTARDGAAKNQRE
jgi:hypothetical protein